MNTSSKPRKTASKRTPKETVPETLFASDVSTQMLPPEPPGPGERLHIAIGSPGGGATLSGYAPLEITVTGTASFPSDWTAVSVEVQLGEGAAWHTATGLEDWSFRGTVDTSGSLTIRAKANATTAEGHSRSRISLPLTVHIEIQERPQPQLPRIQISAPPKVPSSGSIEVTVDVQDPSGSTLRDIWWYVDSRLITTEHFPSPVRSWHGTKMLPVLYTADNQPHTIMVRAQNGSGKKEEYRTVIYNDENPPTLSLLYPKNNAKVPIGSTVVVRGWAEDRQSGVKEVRWWFDGSGPSVAPLPPVPAGSPRINWSFKIENFPAGSHALKLQLSDNTSHEATIEIQLIGATPYKPRDVNDLVGLRAYLEDLVDYAKAHVNTRDAEGHLVPKTQLTEADLADVFYQPFEKWIDGRQTFGDRPVNQLRAAIEVLRKHVSPVSPLGDGAQFLSQSVPHELQPGQMAAVSITMKNIGTSTWTAADGYALGTEYAQPDWITNQPTWGTYRELLSPTDIIKPGESKNFEFQITAPPISGIYNFRWRMMRRVAGFGDYTPNLVITVLESPTPLLSTPTDMQASTPTVMSASAAEPPSQLQAAAEDPCQSVDSHPWIIWISPPQNYPIQSPSEFGSLTVSYTVERGHPDCPIGRIEWSDRTIGLRFPNDSVPNVQSWTNTRTFTIPYDTRQEHILDMNVWNKRGPGRRHTELRFTFVDGTAPELKIVSPQNNEKVPTRDPVVVRGAAEDRQSRVDKIEWKLDAGSFQSASFSPDPENIYLVNWSFAIPNLTEGPHTLALNCVDKKGNAKAAEITIIGEPVVPRPSVTITGPPDGTEIGGTSEIATIEVSGQAKSLEPGNPLALIEAIEWSLDDREVAIDPIAPPQETVDITKRVIQIPYTLQKEQRKLTVFARTVSGVRGQQTVSLLYQDKTPPTFAIVSPKNDAKVPVGTPLVVRGWVEDRQSGVGSIEWSLDGSTPWNAIHPSAILPDVGDSHRVNWQFMTDLTFGEHVIRMRFCDKKEPSNCTPDAGAMIKVIAVAPVTETDYRMAAYEALLKRTGTSYEELRLARGADEKTRLALASRLGIVVSHLDELLLLPADVTEANLEELFGYGDTRRDPLTASPTPLLLQWRQEYLEALWFEQDWPKDPYSLDQLPVIDPDLIGPDDLRRPVEGQAPFDRWTDRRAWVDDRLQEFAGMKKIVGHDPLPDLAGMFARMYQPLPAPYTGIVVWNEEIPPSAFDELRANATQESDAEARQDAIEKIRQNLNLTVESFSQLLTFRDKDTSAASDPRNAKVSAEEWQEVYSILAQAQKTALFPAWIADETDRVFLDSMQFWISLREPQEGDWPPQLPPNQPMIDPDVLELIDLPEPAAGQLAIELWENRRLRLEDIRQSLKAEREARGFESMLRLALGHPAPGDPLEYDLDQLNNQRQDERTRQTAEQHITDDLHMTINAFITLMKIRSDEAKTDPMEKPTAREYAEAYAILTQARKVKHEFPTWIDTERGIPYWRLLKARLPRWRASADARQGWQQALRIRSSPSLIDPDLIGEEDLNPRVPNPASDLWQARQGSLTTAFETLQNKRPEGFDSVVSDSIGKPVAELLELERKQKEGIDIGPELAQSFLTRQSFARLLRLRKMAENQTLSAVEWDNLCHILVQVMKQQGFERDLKPQGFPVWRRAEMEQQITLTPKFFQISEADPKLPPWRATLRARLNWQDILQARIDQWQALEDGLAAAVAAVEEQALPILRDALVTDQAGRRGASASELADEFTRLLLVDVKTNGSQRTTRLQQAIETMQGLLFGLRTGVFADDRSPTRQELPPRRRTNAFALIILPEPVREPPPAPDWASWELAYLEGSPQGSRVIECEDDHFDGEWEWLGNYAAWRGALLIYYFPEHLLLPTLRPAEEDELEHLRPTKHFQAFVKEVRKKARLTPEDARAAASLYLDGLLGDLEMSLPADLKKVIHLNFITDQQTDQTLAALRDLCKAVFKTYDEYEQPVPSQIQEIFYFVPLHLALQLQKSGAYMAALDWYQTIYAFNLVNDLSTPIDERKIYDGLEREQNLAPLLARHDHWLLDWLNPHTLAATRNTFNSYTRYTLMSIARCFLEFADAEFTLDTAESLARARGLYLAAQRLLHVDDFNPPDIPADLPDATIFPNPLLQLLRLRVEIQLTKMRWGLNIAGMKRQLDLLTPQAINSLPVIGAAGQIIIPDGQRRKPTPYYFRVLMERSKQIVNIAQQIEAAYLAALEKRDAENYNLLKASHDLQLAQAGEELQNRRVNEATLGVEVARRQQQRAVVMKNEYQSLIGQGLIAAEQDMINSYQEAIRHFKSAGGAGAAAAWAGGVAGAAGAAGGIAGAQVAGALSLAALGAATGGTAFIAAGVIGGLASLFGAGASAKVAKESALAQAAQAQASIAGIHASHERRVQEWQLQVALSEQDFLIGEAQVNVAQAHVGVSQQELKIARTQVTQAQAVADFLARKFTNAELYEWMSDVLGEVYNFFLQQATATAQLAESQLAFERQDKPPKFIQADYWEVPADTSSLTSAEEKAPDRKGLTGSARLLQDLYQLDQYAFETDKRKLNLSQTFSLARLAPLEFEQFRQSGVLTFATPLEIFDREFPGHFLRLIKRVRTSVIALVPPHQGIRATLTASGISRVVTSSADTLAFQEVMVRRDPELVGLTSPIGATGVFELDVQSEMLLPFESMGVDTFWQFEMPRAANPFDFRTVADVLVTVEYTALNSFDYRQQVLKKFDPKLSGERPFSFVNQFADAWYDLHNPEQSDTPMVVKFKTAPEDFPPNLDDLRIEHVLLFFSRAVDESGGEDLFEVEVKNLRFTSQGQRNSIGGGGTTIDGVISTRRGNGASWNIMIGKSPAGEWELELPTTNEVKGWFKDEKIDDILLVITYGGRTPAWPA